MALSKNIVVLVGGVGGAKLALGLQRVVPAEHLTIIVNTGDDFWHYGLRICPDIDTVLYTLSGRVDPVNGWGVAQDTTNVLDTLREYGEDTWFRLGDKDLAVHLLRTHRLRQGASLTEIIMHIASAMQIQPRILPMTDDPVATIIDTQEFGELAFQTYFVRHRWQPIVRGLRYDGIEAARMTPQVEAVLRSADVILFGPSNPWLSIAPILNLPGLHNMLRSLNVPRVAITPIVEGRALKGPAAKIMNEMGYEVSARAVAGFYGDAINGFVSDVRDGNLVSEGLRTISFDTIMTTDDDKMTLSKRILQWIEGW